MTVRIGSVVTVRDNSDVRRRESLIFTGQVLAVTDRTVAVRDLTSGQRVLVFVYQIVEVLA